MYWFFEFVDPKGKEVRHGLTGDHGKPAKPMLLKAHLWKNAFHVFEQRMDVIHIVPRALLEGLTR